MDGLKKLGNRRRSAAGAVAALCVVGWLVGIGDLAFERIDFNGRAGAVSNVANAAPPKRRTTTTATANDAKNDETNDGETNRRSLEDRRGGATGSQSGVAGDVSAANDGDGASTGRFSGRRRRNAETNDGALPESEAETLFDVDEAEFAERWRDPDEAAKLRAETLDAARNRRKNWPKPPKIDDATAEKLGIRRIDGKNVVLRTDLPSSPATDELPAALDAALPEICRIFELDAAEFADFKVEAFLMRDAAAFVRIGALDGPPKFLHGYSFRTRIFALDHRNEYYNRFLLTHELVHSVAHAAFGDLRPRWFSEGTAEYLAVHRWESSSKSIEIAQFPTDPDATPGFARLENVRKDVRNGAVPNLAEILNFEPRDYLNNRAYSWSWALVAFLRDSPKYRDVFRNLAYWTNVGDPNRVFCATIGDRWPELELDWRDFVGKIDYRFDFERTAIDATPGKPFAEAVDASGAVEIDVSASAGWQNTGVELAAGTTYKLTTTGRFQLFVPKYKKTIDFEGNGATFEYAFGVPTGRLLAAVAPTDLSATFDEFYDPASENVARPGAEARSGGTDAGRSGIAETGKTGALGKAGGALYPWDAATAFETTSTTLTPERSGTLFLRINAAPSTLERNKGAARVRIVEKN